MLVLPDDFALEFEGLLLKIHIHKLGDRKVFEVLFPDDRPNLFMSRSVVASGEKMWMSIPEGRQGEALPIGKVIVKFFQQQQNQQ